MWKSSLSKGLFAVLLLLFSMGTSSGQGKASVSVGQMKDNAAGAPSIQFAELRFEAGTVKEGMVVSHEFEFVNAGADALKIRNVIPA